VLCFRNVGAFLKNVGALLQMYQQIYVVSSSQKWLSGVETEDENTR
jgi:hypothetical protein